MTPEEREIIRRHTSTVPVRLSGLARDLGVDVKLVTLEPGISGMIRPSTSSRSGFEIRIDKHETPERQRFTLAHELGHYIHHRDRIGDGITDDVLYRSERISNAEEVQANRFAANVLMPKALLQGYIGEYATIDEKAVRELAEMFRVSIPAMEIRLGVR